MKEKKERRTIFSYIDGGLFWEAWFTGDLGKDFLNLVRDFSAKGVVTINDKVKLEEIQTALIEHLKDVPEHLTPFFESLIEKITEALSS